MQAKTICRIRYEKPDGKSYAHEIAHQYGITFEQGRNELKIDKEYFNNIVTENKDLTDAAKRDLAIAMITLKYTSFLSKTPLKTMQKVQILSWVMSC